MADPERVIRRYGALIVLTLLLVILGLVMACDDSNNSASSRAQQAAMYRASNRSPYIPLNNLEFENYDRRNRLADDPSAILWCTAFPMTGRPVTFPIVGKLTSGSKRPYQTQREWTGGVTSDNWAFPEVPGPDGMYGASGEFRYGFTPGGEYVDFYNMPVICTTQPTVWQTSSSDMALRTDSRMADAHRRAREALQRGGAGGTQEAYRILTEAMDRSGAAPVQAPRAGQ